DKLIALRELLDGTATSAQKKELLKANVAELVELIGGKGAAAKHAPVVTELYDLIEGHLEGTLGERARKLLEKRLVTAAKKVAKSFFGSEAGELVDHLVTLRDVIAGSPDDRKRLQVLKDSIAGLSRILLGRSILSTPQVRAAMLGFDLGRTFGER